MHSLQLRNWDHKEGLIRMPVLWTPSLKAFQLFQCQRDLTLPERKGSHVASQSTARPAAPPRGDCYVSAYLTWVGPKLSFPKDTHTRADISLHYTSSFLQSLLKLARVWGGERSELGGKACRSRGTSGEGYSKTHFAGVHLLLSQWSFSQCLCSIRHPAIRNHLSAALRPDQLTLCPAHVNYKRWALYWDAWIQ